MLSYTNLYKEYYPKLAKLFYKQLTDKDSVEDLVQDTLTKVYSKLHTYNDKYKISTWIYTLAFNVLKNHYRSLSRSPQLIHVRELYDNEYTESFDSPENLLISAELEDAHQKLISSMNEQQIEVYTLKEIEGLTHKEISSQLNIPVGTVKSRLKRAKDFIVNEIKKEAT